MGVWMELLEPQLSVTFSAISQLSVYLADHRSQLSVENRVISQLTVTILTDSQLSVKLHSDPLLGIEIYFCLS